MIVMLPDTRCKHGHSMRPVWLFGGILRWTCDVCSPPRKVQWAQRESVAPAETEAREND